MKRRLLSSLLALCVTMSLLPIQVLAAKMEADATETLSSVVSDAEQNTPEELDSGATLYADTAAYPVAGGNIYFDPATGAITGCDKSVTSAVIPSSINGVTVTSIGTGAFRDCDGLMSVTIPNGITNIGASAFRDCTGLTSVTIPSGVTSIEVYTFDGCSRLANVTIPNSVTSIGWCAFQNCYKLTNMTIPNNVVSIGWGAFYGCNGLTCVAISNSVTIIEQGTFWGCSELTSVTIPNSVTSIGHGAFYGCKGMTSVTIPESVSTIGNGAFGSCSNLINVYYSGNEMEWRDISIDDDNEPLSQATIHYNSAGPGGEPQKVPVWSENTDRVLDAALSQVDMSNLLTNVTSPMDKLKGPEIEIAGQKFQLFEIDSKLDLSFEHIPIEASIDHEKKTLSLLLGFKVKGDTTISRDPYSLIKDDYETGADQYWSAYRDAKDLVKLISGKDASNQAFLNKYRSIDQKLKRFNMDMIVKASGQVAGYVEFSYETGKLEFSEGGAVLMVELKKTLNHRIAAFPASYVTLRFEVSTEGKLRMVKDEDDSQVKESAVKKSTYRFDPAFKAKLETAIGVGLGKNSGKLQGYIEGGFKGDITAEIKPFQAVTRGDPFTASMTGKLYFSWKLKAGLKIWKWKPGIDIGDTYERELYEFGLYPRLELLSEWDSGPLTIDNFLAAAEPITREYLYFPVLMDITDDYSFSKVEYPYAEPTLLRLNDGRLLMVWVGDNGQKADADRTSILYSIYSGSTWSTPAAICESGTYEDHPVICQDGRTVYAIWMQADMQLEGMEEQEAFGHFDLMFSAFDGNRWSTPVCVSRDNNGLAETDYVLVAEGGTVSAAWIENSENDMLMSNGTNTIYLRTYINGMWGEESVIYSTSDQITGLDINFSDGLQMTWSVTAPDGTTTVYHRDIDGSIQSSAGTGQDVRWINGSLYELRDAELYRDGDATGLSGLTNYEIVSSGTQTAVLTLIPTGFTCELYGSYYDSGSGSWGPWVQLTSYDKYIRSYSAVLDESGKLIAALNLVNTDANAEQVYDNTSAMLVVVDDCSYTDLVVGDWLSYDDAKVIPNGALPLSFELTNNSMETLKSFTADINGQRQAISCNLSAGENAIFTVNYQLPAALSAHEITLIVMPNYAAAESNTENNSVSTQVGVADLVTTVSAPELDGSGASIKIQVDNEGYANAENTILTVYRSNFEGEVLCTVTLGTIAAGNHTEYAYQLPDELLFVDDPETMNALCCEVASDAEERELANNSDRIVFDNLLPLQVSITMNADSVKFSVLVEDKENAISNSLLVLALYGEEGKMLAVQTRALSTIAGGSTTAEFTINRNQSLNVAQAKVFWLNDQYVPITRAWEGIYPIGS